MSKHSYNDAQEIKQAAEGLRRFARALSYMDGRIVKMLIWNMAENAIEYLEKEGKI